MSIILDIFENVLNFDSFETKGKKGSEQNSPTEYTTENLQLEATRIMATCIDQVTLQIVFFHWLIRIE